MEPPCSTALCWVHTEGVAAGGGGVAFASGQARPGGHPMPVMGQPSPTAAVGPWDVHLQGHSPNGGTTTFNLPFPVLSCPCGERVMFPPRPHPISPCPWCVYHTSCSM